jgi:hypothetical protein
VLWGGHGEGTLNILSVKDSGNFNYYRRRRQISACRAGGAEPADKNGTRMTRIRRISADQKRQEKTRMKTDNKNPFLLLLPPKRLPLITLFYGYYPTLSLSDPR